MTQVPKLFIHAKWTNEFKQYMYSVDEQAREATETIQDTHCSSSI